MYYLKTTKRDNEIRLYFVFTKRDLRLLLYYENQKKSEIRGLILRHKSLKPSIHEKKLKPDETVVAAHYKR